MALDYEVWKWAIKEYIKENWSLIALFSAGAIVLILSLLSYLFERYYLVPLNAKKPFLNPTDFKSLALSEKKQINHNTVWLRFKLPRPDQRLGLPIGQHITFLGMDVDDGKDVYRAYTPVSDDAQLGSVDFVIKLYEQGKMSKIISKLKVGDRLLFKGPKGKLQYKANYKTEIGMVAGGSGITPCYQVLNAILKNKKDETKVSLIFGNVTEEDILLREELEALARDHSDRFRLHYILDKPPKQWAGSSGYITKEVVKAHLPAPGPDVVILRCGPTPMMEAMKKLLDGVGYSEEMQFQF